MLHQRTANRTWGEASPLADEVPVRLLADTWSSLAPQAGGTGR
jgi:hypothetical protein